MWKKPVSRREFLRSSVAGVAATALPTLADDKTPTTKPGEPIELVPKRKLGKSGIEVSILNQGGAVALNPRHLNIMHSVGIRYLDTAKVYGEGASERVIAEWLQRTGRRKEYFLASKDFPKTPNEWVKMLDQRLDVLQTDYLDLFFVHALGDEDFGGAEGAKWLVDKEWIQAANRMRKSGKVKFLGFSTHCKPVELRARLLNTAAKGSWVDAVMVATSPTLMRENAEFNRALDACHNAGLGLISMKECYFGHESIKDVFPGFAKRGLTPYTAVLTAMWTDERFTSVSSHMDNIKKLRENAEAAKNFKPLSKDELAMVHEMLDRSNRTVCVACDGSCRRASGTDADLNSIARYVAYAEQNGQLVEARKLFAALPPEARNWSGANLKAASHACKCKLDFESILTRAGEVLT
ncbi:MAG: aldo/keto reductase [Phycisphaerae bacterium]|nr:aldo/keto reductase [Phycisphaerae bacterium]